MFTFHFLDILVFSLTINNFACSLTISRHVCMFSDLNTLTVDLFLHRLPISVTSLRLLFKLVIYCTICTPQPLYSTIVWVQANFSVSYNLCYIKSTVKFLNFRTAENFALIYLKFKQRGQSLGYLVKKMQME